MFGLVKTEVRRIVGRREMFGAGVLVGLVGYGITLAVRLTGDGEPGGTRFLDTFSNTTLLLTLMAILLAALAGSYDTAQGTMRYLVMTGVPRSRLYAARIAGTLTSIVLMCLPVIAIGLATAAILPHDPSKALAAGDVPRTVWLQLATPLIFGLVSLGVGAFLRSNGASIGVALGLYLGSGILTGLIMEQVSERAASFLLPAASFDLATLESTELPLYGSALVALAWLAAFLVLGAYRTARDEY